MSRRNPWKLYLFSNLYTYWSYPQPAVPPHQISTYPLGMKLQLWMSTYLSTWQIFTCWIFLGQNFHIWQHLGSNRSDMQLQHLTTIPSIPVHKIYQHLLNSTMPVMPFNTESTGNTNSLWTLFTHPGIYVSAIGLLIPVGIGLFCCYFFWCQPARLVHWPLQPDNMQYTLWMIM